MVTLQDIIAKRAELQKTNPNATNVDARKALEPTSAAPVAGVPPATTPTAPTPAPVAPQVTGVNGEKFTQAPVDTNTGLSTPQQPTAPVAPTTPVDKTPGITQTEFQKAQAESEKIKAQNEAKMQQEAQKSALAQETEQKKAESMIPKTSDAIYQSLVMGQPVTPQKTGAYNEAMFKFNQYKRYASMTPVEMVTALKTGKIGSELDSMLSQNPMYQQAKAEYGKQKQVKNVVDTVKGIYNNSNNIVAEEEDPFAKLSKNLITELGYAEGSSQLDAFTKYVESDPKIIQYTQSLSGINQQINETQTLLSNAIKDFTKMKGDMPMSSFVIATSQSGKFAELNDTLENLKSLRELTQADLAMATQMADAKYKAVSQDIAQANTQRNAIISQAIQAQFALAGQRAEADLAREIAQESMNDPYTAIPQMYAQYQEMGIPFQRSVQQIIQDFEGSGQDLATYLTGLQKTIQSKPEYQAMQAYQMRQYAPPVAEAKSTWTKIGTNPDGSDKYGFVDTTSNTVTPFVSPTGEATGDLRYLADQFPNQAWAKNNNPAGITWNANFDKGQGTAKLLADAGISYSKGTARPANEGGNYVTFNTIEDGLRAQQIMMSQTYGNSTVGKMLSSWVGTSEGPNYAKQVAGMAGISDLNQKVSSLSPEQLSTLQMAKIQKESPGLAKLLQGGTQAGTQGRLADSESTKVINITRQAFGRNPSDGEREEVKKLLKEFPNASINEIGLAIRGLDVPAEKADTAMSFIRVMDKLKDAPDGFEATIGNYIKRDDFKGLNNYIQKHVENDVRATTPPDQYISTPEQNKVTKNIDEIISLINKNKDKIGAVDGRYTQLAKKFKSEPDIQRLQTLMTGTFAGLRKNFAGSAVTATELSALEDFIAGSTTEVPENLIVKLQTLKDIQTGLYNDQRSMYGIPNANTIKLQSEIKNIIPGATGFQSFMSELSNLLK